MKKIALIIGGWYFPTHLYERVKQICVPENTSIEFFVITHREPVTEMINHSKSVYDLELYKSTISKFELQALGYIVHDMPNVIGDYFFFNQWAEIYDYHNYDYILFMHDDNYILPAFKNILIDLFSGNIELYSYIQTSWQKAVNTSEFHYIANSAVGNRKTARGSFSIWSRELIKSMGGTFSMQNVTLTRNSELLTPYGHQALADWNIVGRNFQDFIEQNDFMKSTFRLSPYYRVSKYMIEAERGLIANQTVALNMQEGLNKYNL